MGIDRPDHLSEVQKVLHHRGWAFSCIDNPCKTMVADGAGLSSWAVLGSNSAKRCHAYSSSSCATLESVMLVRKGTCGQSLRESSGDCSGWDVLRRISCWFGGFFL